MAVDQGRLALTDKLRSLVGPHAEEVINLFALAIRHNLTADELRQAMFAYPTGASDVAAMLS